VGLVFAGGEVGREGFEWGCGFAEGSEGGEGVGDEFFGVVEALVDAEDGGPGGFVDGGVLAGGLAELGGVLGHVEDVVDDLEGEAGFFAEGAEAGDGVQSRSGEVASGDDGDGDEGSGFGAVDALDELGGGLDAFGFDVHDLATDHAVGQAAGEIGADAGGDGVGDGLQDGDGRVWRAVEARDGLEGEGLEGVAGEDGGGLAEDDVAGGQAAAEVVVVEGGEVVVDEGIGVDHLERGTERRGLGVEFLRTQNHTGGFETEDGAEAFSAREGAVAHCPVDGVRGGVRRGKQALEGLVGEGCACLEEGLDVRIHRFR
jgi:hypothetical protein